MHGASSVVRFFQSMLRHNMARRNPATSTKRPACHDSGNEPAFVGQFEWLRPMRRSIVKMLGATAVLLPRTLWAATQLRSNCGPTPQPPRPAQASAAEGLPPLPLPVVPQRRTEKKNPPRPPVIVSKIRTSRIEDWGTDLNDINNLLAWMKSKLEVNFTYEEKMLHEIPLESGEVPVLYRTGHHGFKFTPAERNRLRRYVLHGGVIIFDACCGRRAFSDSVRKEIQEILPDHKLKPIPFDHPIFNCYYENAGYVRFTNHTRMQRAGLASPGPSGIEGVEVACQMAVVFSPHDLSCGWDMHTHALLGTSHIESEDALKIGANFMAYVTATRDAGVGLAEAKRYVDATPTRTDKFRVGQLVHEGDWNPDPVGLRNLLDTVGQTTALRISFATEPVEPILHRLSRFPFLYLTGHEDFVWSDAQVVALRQYLNNGGFIFAEACCGRQRFDLALRREMAKVLRSEANSRGRLTALAMDHPLYSCHHVIQKVRYSQTTLLRRASTRNGRPQLKAAMVNGRLAVIYSPVGLNVGWRLKNMPYAAHYEPRSALELGVNVVMYALS